MTLYPHVIMIASGPQSRCQKRRRPRRPCHSEWAENITWTYHGLNVTWLWVKIGYLPKKRNRLWFIDVQIGFHRMVGWMAYTEVTDRSLLHPKDQPRWSRTVVAHGSLLYHCPAASLELNFDPCFSMRTAEMKLLYNYSCFIIPYHLHSSTIICPFQTHSQLFDGHTRHNRLSKNSHPRASGQIVGRSCLRDKISKSWGSSSYFLDHKILVKPPKNHGTWVCMLQKISCTIEKQWKNC